MRTCHVYEGIEERLSDKLQTELAVARSVVSCEVAGEVWEKGTHKAFYGDIILASTSSRKDIDEVTKALNRLFG